MQTEIKKVNRAYQELERVSKYYYYKIIDSVTVLFSFISSPFSNSLTPLANCY